jgi:hypothetical protein
LEIREYGKSSAIDGGLIKLSRARCRSKVRTRNLEVNFGVWEISVRKTKDDEGMPAVEVVAYDEQGNELFYGILQRDVPEPFDAETSIVYV